MPATGSGGDPLTPTGGDRTAIVRSLNDRLRQSDEADAAEGLVAELIGLRDELSAAARLVVVLALACRGLLSLGDSDRGALSELAGLACLRLDAVLADLDSLIASQAGA